MKKSAYFYNLLKFKSKKGNDVYVFEYVIFNEKLSKNQVITNFIDKDLYNKIFNLKLSFGWEIEIDLEVDDFMQLKLIDVTVA